MLDERWSDEDLMAWADGEMAAERAQYLEAAMARDAALARRAALMMETRALSRQAWDAELDAPVPEPLWVAVQAMVESNRAGARPDGPSPEDRCRPARPSIWARWRQTLAGWAQPLPLGVAASVLCAALGFMLGQAQTSAPTVRLAVGEAVPAAMGNVLQRLPSGETAAIGPGQLVPVATYETAGAGLCREFSWAASADPADRLEAVACRDGEAWRLQLAARVPPDPGFAPAAAEEALAPFLSHLGAGEALAPDAERAALAR